MSNLNQATLPLPFAQTSGRFPPPAATPLTRIDGTEYRIVRVRRALGRDGSGAASYRLDPYRANGDPARGRIVLVRNGLPDRLRAELARRDLRGTALRLGAGMDPYPPGEAKFFVVARTLAALGWLREVDLTLQTRSALVLRDLEMLKTLDLGNTVRVIVPLATTDPEEASRLEPGAPRPEARLATVRALAAEGLSVHLVCAPELGALDELEAVFRQARMAGATDVRLAPRRLPFGNPAGAARIRDGNESRLDNLLHRLRMAYGFPARRIGRG